MGTHRGKSVSAKPENTVREAINPFEDLWCPAALGTKSSPASVRIPDQMLVMIDNYTHDSKYPWRSRSDFIVSAVFRMLEDVQRIESHPLFDDSLKKLKMIMLQLANEEDGRRGMEAAQKTVNTVQELLAEGDKAEAKRLLREIKAIAVTMVHRRWREKILHVVKAFGDLSD